MSNIKKWSSFVGIQLLRTCMECTISSVLSKKGSLCEMLMYKANVATPPPMSRPILIVPGFFTASTSSMEKSRPPPSPVHRVFSCPFLQVYAVQTTDESEGVIHKLSGSGYGSTYSFCAAGWHRRRGSGSHPRRRSFCARSSSSGQDPFTLYDIYWRSISGKSAHGRPTGGRILSESKFELYPSGSSSGDVKARNSSGRSVSLSDALNCSTISTFGVGSGSFGAQSAVFPMVVMDSTRGVREHGEYKVVEMKRVRRFEDRSKKR